MIQKETYSLENIKRIKDKYNIDPELAQRSIFALGLDSKSRILFPILNKHN